MDRQVLLFPILWQLEGSGCFQRRAVPKLHPQILSSQLRVGRGFCKRGDQSPSDGTDRSCLLHGR